jgi:hypothetical protein
MEEVESLSVYRGKLYAGTGNSANVDATVWSYGDNAYVQSTTDSFGVDWHHHCGHIRRHHTANLYQRHARVFRAQKQSPSPPKIDHY